MSKAANGYWFLDSVAGWREAAREHLTLTPSDGFLVLDPLPGAASLKPDAPTQAAAFQCPAALAPYGCGDDVMIADAASHLVKSANLASGRVETIPSLGGEGSAPRRLREPRGIAVLPSGAIVVADTGNHRVQLFAPVTHALLQLWGATDALGNPVPGGGRATFKWPWGIAVDRCAVYVADRGNGRIQKIDHDGRFAAEFGVGVLKEPTQIAIAPSGRLAVVDQALEAVFLFEPDGGARRLAWPTHPRSVAFDDRGDIYIGDTIGIVYAGRPDGADPGGFRMLGGRAIGLDGVIVALAWSDRGTLLAIVRENYNGQRQRIWQIDPQGACVLEGTFVTSALDSGIEGCQWHRVLLNAALPLGTAIEIDSYTSDSQTPIANVIDLGFPGWTQCVIASGKAPGPSASAATANAPETHDDAPECLIQSGPGQYLWLRLRFRSSGRSSPVVRWLKAFFPRNSYLQHLPAVYQEDDESREFLERFLSLFQTELEDLDERIGMMWQLFDPGSVDADKLGWLAEWIGLVTNPEWPPARTRQMIGEAPADYRQRGTVAGLEHLILEYAGVRGKILEHFRLRRWPVLSVAAPLDSGVRLWSRDFYHRLQLSSYSQVGYFQLRSEPEPAREPFDWGANRFTVFFPADPYDVDTARNKVAQVVEREKPAHTEATLCPVFPRFRVGIQATVGVDSCVGTISNLVLNRLATLNYDSILACSKTEQSARGAGSALRPVTGVTTRLL